MDKISKGAVFTVAFTTFFNVGCIRAHYKVLKVRNQNQESLQALVDYRRKKLDEEWETCNEFMDKMGKTVKKSVWRRKKKKFIFSRSISLGKRCFKLWKDAALKWA